MEHKIKELIKEKGYTQQEFADLLGMSRVGLAQIVNGKPSYPTLEKIATALNVPMWQLFASPDGFKYFQFKHEIAYFDTREEAITACKEAFKYEGTQGLPVILEAIVD